MKLVFVENNRPVTDSLTVAETFGKDHSRVMRDIRELGCSEVFRVGNFAESVYLNQQGRETPKFLMTEQGFALLAMGYTGKKAMSFKEQYILEFDNLRIQLSNKVEVMSERKALIQSLKLTAELADEVEEIKDLTQANSQRIFELEAKVDEQITLDSGDQRKVQKVVARKIYSIEVDNKQRSQLFRQLHREIKDRWAVPSYKDIRKHELDGLMNYIEAWRPIAT
ncbi:Rha family transcriptional regulator [Paenibacillus alkaliterrae]|uniref:Rha family transcriptional regulator n=1 Tax=Paenibacillus alkaliterrae TaxID=320909 RepID=UPI001F40A026|nr:Rha family transcriptional regulator [Paenibacillus alkaliterrae]MCF2938947.1 Rha family transcriptional regulator [Paenibacillus alkaliterrae]